jgi:hypothetical protein
MLARQLVLFLMVGGGVAESQTNCSPKIFDEDGINSCDFMEERPDTARMIFAIGLDSPPINEENTPESLAKLRKWTDTLFLEHDIRFVNSRDQKAPPPPDSELSWVYFSLYLNRETILAVAKRDFVKRISYRSTPPAVTIIHPNRKVILNQGLEYFEINGRLLMPGSEGAKSEKPNARKLFNLRSSTQQGTR